MKISIIQKISIVLVALIISMPLCFAAEMSLVYDANGNLITGDGKFRVYNSLNQLSRIYNGSNSSGFLIEQYTYHPVEERILSKKVYNNTGALLESVYYINQNYVQVINLTGTFNYTYYYLQGQLIAQDVNGIKTFFATDNKGDIVATTNTSGNLIENNSYSPTGEVLATNNKSRYTYEGKELDKASGQTDYNARMYQSSTAQFQQPDTYTSNIFNPQDLNAYSFEYNNPFKNTDSSGHSAIELGAFGYGGFGVGGADENGIVIVYDPMGLIFGTSYTWNPFSAISIGTYNKQSIGGYLPSAGGGLAGSYYPLAKSFNDVAEGSYELNGEVGGFPGTGAPAAELGLGTSSSAPLNPKSMSIGGSLSWSQTLLVSGSGTRTTTTIKSVNSKLYKDIASTNVKQAVQSTSKKVTNAAVKTIAVVSKFISNVTKSIMSIFSSKK